MRSHSIVFIDSRVTNYEALIAGFSAGTRWHVLDAQQDGIAQIERLLAGESDLDAIHIISHGAPGTLYLGSTVLTGSKLPGYAQQLQTIGSRLTVTGDILLYGCNVAQGGAGQAFVNALAVLTGADVTASDDATGPIALGGNSVLEQIVGTVDVSSMSMEGLPVSLGDDYSNTTATTGVVPVGGQATGNIELVQDEDWFKVSLVAGTTYLFELRGLDGGGGTLGSGSGIAYLALYGPNGLHTGAAATSGGTGDDPLMSYVPTVSGQYYLSVSDLMGVGTGTYTLRVTEPYADGVNNAPTGAVTISGTAAQGQTLTAANTLADVDGLGTVSYQWNANDIAINGATGATFKLTQAEVGKTISVTASYTDGKGTAEGKTSVATSAVTNANDAPIINPIALLTFTDTAQADIFLLEQSGQIQAQDIDSVQLSYRISGGTNVGAYSTVQGTYGSLQVHIGTGAYTFFANNAAIQGLKSNASETFTVTVSDGALTAQAPLTVQITGANDAPVLRAPILDQMAYGASAWSLTLPGTHFADADTGDVLGYSARLMDGSPLPTWLAFDPVTRTFSGTPGEADLGSLSIRVTASDGSLSASDVFSLVVNEHFEPVVDDSSVATYARSANQYTVSFDPASQALLVTDTDPQRYEVRKFTDAKRIEFADLSLNLGVRDLAGAIPEPSLNRIAELYVAFFNRVPDGDGMEFWIEQYRQGKSINDIAEAFYDAGVYFSDLTGYRPDMSNGDFIHIVYRNVLGRPEGADQEGLAFWRAELDSGRSAKGTLVSSILDAAHGSAFSDPTNPYHWVQQLLDNKLEVAKQVSVQWGVNYNSSEDSIAKGRAIAAAITPDDTSVAISLVGVVEADMV